MSTAPGRASSGANPHRHPPTRLWRLLTRGVILVAALLALGPLARWSAGPAILAGLSPHVATGSILATRSMHALAWLGLAIGVVAILRRRFLCRWLCPTGLALDGAGKIGCTCGRQPARPGRTGTWLVWLSLGGAILGLPLFLWLDPLALFSAAASIPHPDSGLARWYAVGMLVILLALSIGRPGRWCRQLCPLGAFQELIHDTPRAIARWMRKSERTPSGSSIPHQRAMKRRAWLGLAGGSASALVLPRVGGPSRQVLRPPGALDDPAFNGVCLRCGNCLRACPSGVIHNAGAAAGWLGLFTPTLSFKSDYCREDCVRCGEVCPSGALRRVPIREKEQVQIGLPTIEWELCLLAEERECSHCRSWCPAGAIRYVFSQDDYLVHPHVDPDLCNGCGACEAHCPVTPVKAITIAPRNPAKG